MKRSKLSAKFKTGSVVLSRKRRDWIESARLSANGYWEYTTANNFGIRSKEKIWFKESILKETKPGICQSMGRPRKRNSIKIEQESIQ